MSAAFFIRIKHMAAFFLIAVGAAFIIFGVMRTEHHIVLQKAVRICLECIGIG